MNIVTCCSRGRGKTKESALDNEFTHVSMSMTRVAGGGGHRFIWLVVDGGSRVKQIESKLLEQGEQLMATFT